MSDTRWVREHSPEEIQAELTRLSDLGMDHLRKERLWEQRARTAERGLTLAYLAGVIDSDGYITIHRSTRKGVVYYAARVGIAGTRSEPHELAASLWGGKVSRHVPKNPNFRVQYQWSRTGDPAIGPILAVQPYLRVKAEQARIALELQEHVIAGRGDDPFPWFGPDYDPKPYREEARAEIVEAMKAAGRELDGRTWDEMPA